MKPYYDDGQCVIYHGDCRELRPSADVVVTDPPYGVGIDASFSDEFTDGLEGFDAAVGTLAAVFMSPRRLSEIVAARSWKFERVIWMHKPGDIAHPWRGWHMNSEAIAIFSRDGASWPKPTSTRTDVYFASGRGNRLHPCEKPIDVVLDLVRRLANPASVVLDPFMGSGTTLAAAKIIGRKAIGIEREERYCEIAARRLAQGSLFVAGSESETERPSSGGLFVD